MKSFSKVLGTVLAVALAISSISVPAFAHDPQKHKGPGILPLLAGPVIAGSAVGTSSSTIVKAFKFKKWQGWGWKKVHYLKNAGYDVTINKYGKKVKVRATKTSKSHSNMGKAVVGCIMGSAFGAITASMRKATALGNPPRWRSQAEHEKIVASGYEKQFELTNDEAQTAIAFCGLGSFALHWEKRAPVVKAKY
jgi:hypothetical protein